MVLQSKGDLHGAIAQYEKAKQFSDDPHISALSGAAKALAGDKNAALHTLTDLDKINQHRAMLAYSPALLHISLNNRDHALRWPEQSFAVGNGSDIGAIKV